jgi:hypothetical protein
MNQQKTESMNKWINEAMNQQINDSLKQWINEPTNINGGAGHWWLLKKLPGFPVYVPSNQPSDKPDCFSTSAAVPLFFGPPNSWLQPAFQHRAVAYISH